jgi:hypothetical protein
MLWSQQSINNMNYRGERNDGWTGGWVNNFMVPYSKRKGCVSQASQTSTDLNHGAWKSPLDDNWSFKMNTQTFPYPHAWVEATSDNPSDPKITIDPWRNTITPQYPAVTPPPYSGGSVNAPVNIGH